jgi:hypothetical protein
MMPPLMPPLATPIFLMQPLMPREKTIAMRILATLATVATDMETPRVASPQMRSTASCRNIEP